ncbi:RyR domain-containing protein [Acinetobacter sp. BSP-28]|uniref:RyR domain-containing protein n=1 Tax=Acinetobacter sp. BSP-28 TaxID=3344661 RepID=UPI00377020D1
MKLTTIAMLCHSINAAYCLSQGDESQPSWDSAPDWQKKSALLGVEMHLKNPDATPEQSHESWYAQKEKEGWKYGEVKDAEKKEHPCFLPYAELPAEQKAKDYLFKAVVNLARDLPDPSDVQDLSAEIVKLQQQLQNVKSQPAVQTTAQAAPAVGVTICYKANRDTWTDNLYGTQLVFKRGVPRTVPSNLAQKFLSHPEFERVEGGALTEQASTQDDTQQILDEQAKKKQQADEAEELKSAEIQAVRGFRTKDTLIKYVEERYKEKLDSNLKLDELKQVAVDKIHQFGVV